MVLNYILVGCPWLDSTKVPFILSHAYHALVLLFLPYTVLSQSVRLELRFIHNSVFSLPPTFCSDWNLCLVLRLFLMFPIYFKSNQKLSHFQFQKIASTNAHIWTHQVICHVIKLSSGLMLSPGPILISCAFILWRPNAFFSALNNESLRLPSQMGHLAYSLGVSR